MSLAYHTINPSQQKSVFYGYSNVELHVPNWWADMDRRRKCNVSTNNNHYSGKYKVIMCLTGASVNHLTPAFCKVNNAVTILRGWVTANLKKTLLCILIHKFGSDHLERFDADSFSHQCGYDWIKRGYKVFGVFFWIGCHKNTNQF